MIFFKAHFATSFGTLKNIIALNYGIPLPKGASVKNADFKGSMYIVPLMRSSKSESECTKDIS